MNDPFVSYDTFSVGNELGAQPEPATPAAPKEIPLLARLERLSTPPKETKKRFDEAEPALAGIHHYDETSEAGGGGSPVAVAPRVSMGNPTATIRIDTVSPTDFDEATPATSAAPVVQRAKPAEASSVELSAIPGDDALEDPWAAWLLNLESAVLPYSRIIVLAAVIAALGLTLVLLQSGTKQVETNGTAPQVLIDNNDSVLASTTDESAPLWSGEPVAATDATHNGLRPLDTPAPAALASGPASAARGPGRVSLTGEVRAFSPERVNVADASGQPHFSRTK